MNNKKTIITLILILLIGIIGLTVAYFSNSTTIDNLFSTKEYGSTITETFTSPNNWLPGDTTEKKVVATNTGEVDQAVRISYTEKWLDSNNNELNGWIHEDGSKSSHETEEELSNDERVALINFDNNDDWTYNNGFYYYNYRLQPNESTSSLIKSVSFNSKTKLDDTCTTTISEGKKIITCNSSGDNYDGATYTLTFNIETVQFNKYMNAWNTDVAIAEEKIAALSCSYEIGDEIIYDDEKYYVIKNSDDYVVALKDTPLTAEEVNTYSGESAYVSQDGEYLYYTSSTCYTTIYAWGEFLDDDSGCTSNYDQSNIKPIVDGWSNNYNDDLISINGYKARLLNIFDLGNLNFEYGNRTPSDYIYTPSLSTPEWINIDGKTYWSMIKYQDSYSVYGVSNNLSESKIYKKNYIRPVINLKKSAIESVCPEHNGTTTNNNSGNNYSIGDRVFYNTNAYCVIENSDDSMDYVTLIKEIPLNYNEIFIYKGDLNDDFLGYGNGTGLVNYYKSDTCYYNDSRDYKTVGCTNDYDSSSIKKIVDNWSNEFIFDLKEIDGYKARLIKSSELIDLGHIMNVGTVTIQYIVKSDVDCLYIDTDYWAMDLSWLDDGQYINSTIDIVSKNRGLGPVYDQHAIRPVINLKKCAIDNTCE